MRSSFNYGDTPGLKSIDEIQQGEMNYRKRSCIPYANGKSGGCDVTGCLVNY